MQTDRRTGKKGRLKPNQPIEIFSRLAAGASGGFSFFAFPRCRRRKPVRRICAFFLDPRAQLCYHTRREHCVRSRYPEDCEGGPVMEIRTAVPEDMPALLELIHMLYDEASRLQPYNYPPPTRRRKRCCRSSPRRIAPSCWPSTTARPPAWLRSRNSARNRCAM